MNARGTRTADYDYVLPPDRIAQQPAERRDASRLMIVDRREERIRHGVFRDLRSLVAPGDALAINTSRVIHARLLGQRESGAPAEVFLLRALGESRYEAMVHPGGKLKPGRTVTVSPELGVEIEETTERRTRIVRLRSPLPDAEAIARFGKVPLPPYIARPASAADAQRYQTIYAREPGSVAAPTAGLHFTPELLDDLRTGGARIVELVLHVGAGTFKPVENDDPAAHAMHHEWFRLAADGAAALNAARDGGGSVWGVGTTAVRALESSLDAGGRFAPREGDTNIFIRPPQTVRGVDKMVTNFHLPRSTLLMLVAAFAGYELIMRAYHEAIEQGYRFYSYGDAMAIV